MSLLLVNGNIGNLKVERGDNVTLAQTTNVPIVVGRWYYIEFKATIHDTTGSYEVRIDGVPHSQLTASGVDTKNSANASADRIYFGSRNTFFTGTGFYLDDVYIFDGTGSAPKNNFIGDVNVVGLLPNGNGNSSQFLGSDADSTNNYQLVDENPPNDDTDYVEASTVGYKDTYTYQDLTGSSGTVYGVSAAPYARKTDSGARKIRTLARLSSTEIDNGTDLVLGTSYVYYNSIFETKPGGGAWAITDVNNAEFGHTIAA